MEAREQAVSRSADRSTLRRAVAAAALGNGMEWFDFGIYAYLAATLGTVFFPSSNPTASLLLSLATFGVAFVVRPFGGFFFGPLGDRLGRQRILATTILLMSGSTFAIGLLPGYASIGILAPILLVFCRLLQGFSTGGEYGGASTFIAEYAPDNRRGFFGSWLEFATLGGFVLGASIVTVLTIALPDAAMNSWGWRVPFLIAGPLGIVGLYLRLKLEDTPNFKALEETHEVTQSPLRESFTEWRAILRLIGIVILVNVADYIILSYMPTYLPKILEIGDNSALMIIVLTMVVMMAVITLVGSLTDRVGRKPVMLTGCIGFAVLTYPAFWLMSQGNILGTAAGLLILGLLLVLILGTIGSMLPALFPTRCRYGAFCIGYNVSTSLFGGTAPFVATYLISVTGDNFVPAYYLIIASVVAFIPIVMSEETAGDPLKQTSEVRTTGVPVGK